MMPTIPNITGSILALDVGDKRVGVARASAVAKLPEPLTTLHRGLHFFDDLQKIIEDEQAGAIVVGLPRSLSGQETSQTKLAKTFMGELRSRIDLPVYSQDEALTSRKAEVELGAKGDYSRQDVDALAATYILEDFLTDNTERITGGAS